VLVIGFTGEVGALVTGVVIGLTGVFVFVIGLTGATGALVVLVIGLTGEVFTAPEAGLTVDAVLVGEVLGATGFTTEVVGVFTGATGFVPPEVMGLPTGVVGRAGIPAGVLTPPTGRFVLGAKVPALSTPEGGRVNA
jgi:hypothetical protein